MIAKEVQIIILAAGKGSRMNSDLPKPIHKIGNQTMLDIVINNAQNITSDILLVYSELLKPYIEDYPYIQIEQKEALGTGHALYTALDNIKQDAILIVLYADNPFISSIQIHQMLNSFIENKADIMIMAFNKENPEGYGRIVEDEKGYVKKIVESRDANPEESKITLCNSGILILNTNVTNNLVKDLVEKQKIYNGEYYLTSLLEMAYERGLKTNAFKVSNDLPMGVNTPEELEIARLKMQNMIN